MNLRNKIVYSLLVFFLCCGQVSARTDNMFCVLNPDAYSQAAGASILSLSPSVFGFFVNPASNYRNFSKEFQLSYTSFFDRNYGLNAGFLIPTEKKGIFTLFVSGTDFNKSGKYHNYKSSVSGALNYVYPIICSHPYSKEKGSAGATLKIYNINLQNDNSIMLYSLDFGLIYSLDFIDRNLTAGFALKNIGNDFDVNGYDYDMSQNKSWTLSAKYFLYEPYKISVMADLVKSFNVSDCGFAAGIEAKPFYPFSVRAGWRDYRDNFNKGVTAGFGLDFDRVNISYSFSDLLGSDDDQHIFSVGIYFGKIPDSGKAYEHYSSYYLNRAIDYYNKKDYIAARKEFEDILAVYPENPTAKKYLSLLSEDLEQSDIDMSGKVEKYTARADAAMLRNNLVSAQKYYQKALSYDENNEQARKGLESAQAKIKEQEAYLNRKKHQKEISDYWVKAMNHYDKGEFVFAKDELLKITEIDPENAGALQYLSFIQKKIDKVSSVQANNIFKQGMEEYENRDYEKALSYFNAAYISDPSRDDIKEYIDKCKEQIVIYKNTEKEEIFLTNKQIEEQMKDVYNKALEYYTLKDYESSINTFEQLRAMSYKYKYFNYNDQIKSYTEKAKLAVSKEYYSQAKELEKNENLEAAYDKYEEAYQYSDKNEQAKKDMDRLKEIFSQRYYSQALKSFKDGDSAAAEELLRKSLQFEPEKPEAQKLLEKITQ